MSARDDLVHLIAGELAQTVPPGVHVLVDRLRERYGSALRAVVFYGSCLRRQDDRDGVLDLYVLVDRYRTAYASRTLRLLNHLLPPNVFYLEARAGARVVRAKYAVLALDALGRFVSSRAFGPYFWARFSQPCALVYAADEAARAAVTTALANAVETCVGHGVHLVPPRFDSRALWTATWRETYRAELRAERLEVVQTLYADAPQRYQRAAWLVLQSLPVEATVDAEGDALRFEVRIGERDRRAARMRWPLRRAHGKTLFLLRLLRNGLIFEGGADYVLSKIQRHSGVAIDSSWRDKRHPLLALGAEAWRLYRAGGFH